MSPRKPARRDGFPARLEPLFHLTALWGLAVAQPLYDLLTRNPAVILAHRMGVADGILLVLCVSLAPPVLLYAAVAAAERAGRVAGRLVLGLFITVLAMTALLPPAGRAWPRVPLPALLATALAAGFLLALARRWRTVRSWLSVMALGAMVFPALFLFRSPAGRMIVQETMETAQLAIEVPRPVVVVVFDEFPATSIMDEAGRLDRRRFPGFAELARRAVWYRNASAAALVTMHAVPAIVSGIRPVPSLDPVAADWPHSLFTLLGGTYAIRSFERVTRLCPDYLQARRPPRRPLPRRIFSLARDSAILTLHAILPRRMANSLAPLTAGFRDFLFLPRHPKREQEWQGIPAKHLANFLRNVANLEREDREEDFRHFLAALSPEPRAALYFIHVYLPHQPWIYLPSGHSYASRLSRTRGFASLRTFEEDLWNGPPGFVGESHRRHLLQAGYADTLVASLLRRLDAIGIADDCLLVVTADHGACFRPGQSFRGLSGDNWPDLLGVPLFIKYPGTGPGRTDDGNAENVDILPTIADILNVALPWPVDGRSLVAGGRTDDGRKTFLDDLGRKTHVRGMAAFLAGRQEALGIRARLLDPDGNPPLPAEVSAMLGKPPMPSPGPAWGVAEIEETEHLSRVSRGDGFVPAWLTGTLECTTASRQPAAVLVALNGVLRQAAFFGMDGCEVSFGAILPEALLREGANSAEVFVVPAGGPPWRLMRTSAPDAPACRSLVRLASGREELAMVRGRPIPVEPAVITGLVESRTVDEEGVVRLSGWAVDQAHYDPAAFVVFCLESSVLATAVTGIPRPDIAGMFNCASCRDSGFEVVFPSSWLGKAPLSSVRVFAAFGQHATEIFGP